VTVVGGGEKRPEEGWWGLPLNAADKVFLAIVDYTTKLPAADN